MNFKISGLVGFAGWIFSLDFKVNGTSVEKKDKF